MRALATLTVSALAVFAAATPTAAAKPFPKLANGYEFAVKPKTVSGWTGNGSQVLGGQSEDPPVGYEPGGSFGAIAWQLWTQRRARGEGVLWRNDCDPSCGAGSWHGEPMRVSAFRARKGHFTRMRLTCACKGPSVPYMVLAYRGSLPPQWRVVDRG